MSATKTSTPTLLPSADASTSSSASIPARPAPPTAKEGTTPGFACENRRSLYRKGIVGDWQRFATPGFVRWIKEEAGEALEQLGYGWEPTHAGTTHC